MSLSNSVVTRVVGVTVENKIIQSGEVFYLPQRLSILGQGNTASTYGLEKTSVTTAAEVAVKYGYGSPLHLAVLQLFPANGDGIGAIPVTILPLEDAGGASPSDGSIDITGAQSGGGSVIVKINEIATATIVAEDGDTAEILLGKIKTAIQAVLEMPIIPGTVAADSLPFDSKWGGLSANDIFIEVDETDITGTFSLTQPTGGLANPSAVEVVAALANIGQVWETCILNLLNYDDATILDEIKTFGVGRWGTTEKKPLFSVSGTAADLATRTAISDARKTDFINGFISAVGSSELPFVIAARALAKDILPTANDHPAQNYKGRLTGLVAGADSAQEDTGQRQASILAGSSNSIKADGEIELNDTVTFHHPDGEINPAYRYVVNIVKLQNIVFNVRLVTETDELKGAPLVPDGTPTTEPTAKKPKNIRTILRNLADNLAKSAIISDADYTKNNLTVEFDSQNPNRLNDVFPVKLSGNIEVQDVTIAFSFFFGS